MFQISTLECTQHKLLKRSTDHPRRAKLDAINHAAWVFHWSLPGYIRQAVDGLVAFRGEEGVRGVQPGEVPDVARNGLGLVDDALAFDLKGAEDLSMRAATRFEALFEGIVNIFKVLDTVDKC